MPKYSRAEIDLMDRAVHWYIDKFLYTPKAGRMTDKQRHALIDELHGNIHDFTVIRECLVRYRTLQMGFLGRTKEERPLLVSIYAKNGYAPDGIHTIDEYKKMQDEKDAKEKAKKQALEKQRKGLINAEKILEEQKKLLEELTQ